MISVIIPTYNRGDTLLKTLASIEQQAYPNDEFEVILIDDGSTDETFRRIDEFRKSSTLNLRYYCQENAGPARARNKGIENAKGEIVFFCGDDALLARNLLNQHALSHKKRPGHAVLGWTLWDEESNPTEFMRYLAPSGPQFHYDTIRDCDDAGFNHFYASNISISKKWLEQNKFSEDFKYAAFEDIHLGLVLEKAGLKISFNRNAVIYHSHFYTPELFYQRMVKVGESAVVFRKKFEKDIVSFLKINVLYTPFMFFPFGLRLFHVVSGALRNRRLIKTISKRTHWFFNVAYYYSLGILRGLGNERK